MKPQLKGNLAELYAVRATKARHTKTFDGVEWIARRTDRKTGAPAYYICICGINCHAVPIAAYYYPGENTAYFWQCANRNAVNDIMRHPENAYNWFCVKNGIRL